MREITTLMALASAPAASKTATESGFRLRDAKWRGVQPHCGATRKHGNSQCAGRVISLKGGEDNTVRRAYAGQHRGSLGWRITFVLDSKLAPAVRSKRMVATWPPRAASCRAVRPSWFEGTGNGTGFREQQSWRREGTLIERA